MREIPLGRREGTYGDTHRAQREYSRRAVDEIADERCYQYPAIQVSGGRENVPRGVLRQRQAVQRQIDHAVETEGQRVC